jgi:RimJ/RimL family protein N-acetyltransferase
VTVGRSIEFATAEEASMDAFLSVSAASPFGQQLQEYAESLLRQGCTRPEWCVLGTEGGAPVVRAALWSMPGESVPTDVVLIDTDWSQEDLSAGQAMLARMQTLAADLGAGSLSHSVDSPPGAPQYQDHEEARVCLLVESGYELLRDGLRWIFSTSPADEDPPPQRLSYRALPDVGEDTFVAAMAATYEGTRDSWITRTIEERGALGAARADFLDYQAMEHRPEWWELAYTDDQQLAGVIMAARNPGSAVIGFVGIVPEQRGSGFAVDLVRRGTEVLVGSGATEIRGDCDRENVGMVKAFERAGYRQFARRRTFRRLLS